MKIKPRASEDELTSPFFIKNKVFCSKFESFIASKNGLVKGDYSAWSYLIQGKFTVQNKWKLTYKKSTFTNHGLFLLFSKFKNTVTFAEWQCKFTDEKETKLIIRRKKLIDFFLLKLTSSISRLDQSSKYVLIYNGIKTKYLNDLIKFMSPVLESKEVHKIELINSELKIKLKTEKHHFDILERLIAE